MKYRAFIFDLDGVLCETDRYHYMAWKKLADSLDIPFNEEINNRLRGISRRESLEIILENSSKHYSDKEKEEMLFQKNEDYKLYLNNMSPENLGADTLKVLNTIKDRGIKIAIGSSSKNAEFILKKLGIYDLFDYISDGNGLENSKPDPEVFIRAAGGLKLEPSECLVVEDASSGVLAANRGNMDVAGIKEAAKLDTITYSLNSISDLLNI